MTLRRLSILLAVALVVAGLAAWRLFPRLPGSGETAGEARPVSAEGAAVPVSWRVSWTLAPSADAPARARLRRDGADAVVRAETESALAELVKAQPADALRAESWGAEAGKAVGARLARSGLDARVTLTAQVPAPSVASSRPGARVLLVGIDGMDWQLADPLLAAGSLPNLAALIQRGARGELRSEEPMLSPLLWTTMATGRLPEDHGVLDFLAVNPATGKPVPITSGFRRVPALWDMAGAAGLDSVFVGWWATWPAEPVRGALVSDRLAYTALEGGVESRVPGRLAYPQAVADEVVQLATAPSQVESDLLKSFVPDADARAADERVQHLRRMLAGALTYHRATLALLKERPAPLMSVYYELVDQVGHRFMHLAPPRRGDVSARDHASFSGCVAAAYVLQDRLLGELLAAVPPETDVLLVSDHGFLSGASRPAGTADVMGKPGRWHRVAGVVVAAGPSVPAGTQLDGATVRDVAPTVLALLGLPVGEDMPGRALLTPGVAPRRIRSWSDVVKRGTEAPAASDAALDAAAVEQLAALGYVGDDAAASPPAPAPPAPGDPSQLGTTASWHLNRATCLELRKNYGEAAKEARLALDRHPLPEAWLIVARAAERSGDAAGALDAARHAVAIPDAEAPAFLTLADLLVAARQLDEAEQVLRGVLGKDRASLAAQARLASVLMLRGDLEGAAREAEKVRDSGGASADAWVLAASVFGRAERPKDALDCILKARALGADDAGSYLVEALSRAQLGDESAAHEVVKRGLAKYPDDATLKELSAALAP